MCGIVGYIGKDKDNNESMINSMNDAIFHRGPDGFGLYADACLGLGMRRLAIIDIAGGDQPIWNKDKTKCIFFNGEIYNYQELRSEILTDYEFETNSDTETILALYEYAGKDAPKFLRGMFAFAIYDLEKDELFIARDHFGIKPFYYFAEDGKLFSFASEIKAILKDSRYKKSINENAIYNYLQYQYNPLEETFFKNIFKLSPGNTMTVDTKTGEYSIEPYYKFIFSEDKNMQLSGAKEDIQLFLADSVAHHAIADVPVGSFLSGGVDSSVNATLLTNHRNSKIHTFTIGSKDRNEFIDAKETSDAIRSHHHPIEISREDYMDALPKVIYHFDEPVADPSAILLYLMAKEARKHVTVVLSGEGADEFFGGYTIYREYYDRRKMDQVPYFVREYILKPLTESNIKFYGKNYLKRYFTPLRERYFGNATTLFNKKEMHQIWNADIQPELFNIGNLYDKAKYYSEPTQMQYIDIHTWLVGDILAKADKMTMAHSLELRVPFLDVRVAEYAKHLPDRLKFHDGTTKYALREAFKGIIPGGARKRRKLGFPTALASWMKHDMPYFEKSILHSELLKKYINMDEVKKLIHMHQKGKANTSRKLFALYMLAQWHTEYFK